jgi:hypothetical protein
MLRLRQKNGSLYPLPQDEWSIAQMFAAEITGGLDALYCVFLSSDRILGADLLETVGPRMERYAAASDVSLDVTVSVARKAAATAIILCRTSRGDAACITAADHDLVARFRQVAEHGITFLGYHVIGLTSASVGVETRDQVAS